MKISPKLFFSLSFMHLVLCPLVSAKNLSAFSALSELERNSEFPKHDLKFPCSAIGTEADIGRAAHLYSQGPEGLFVSIGGERSFRGASMAKATGLLILDICPDVLRFSEINRELLKAPTLELYQKLRFTRDFISWKSFQEELIKKGIKIQRTLSEYDMEFWIRIHTVIHGIALNHMVNTEFRETFRFRYPKLVLPDSEYATANYLVDSELYSKLHTLALEEKIFVVHKDLGNERHIELLTKALEKFGQKVGVLDLDNLYTPGYIGWSGYSTLISQLLPFGNPDSLVMVMCIDVFDIANINNEEVDQRQIYYYRTFTFFNYPPSWFLSLNHSVQISMELIQKYPGASTLCIGLISSAVVYYRRH